MTLDNDDIQALASAVVDELFARTKAKTPDELMASEEFVKILTMTGRKGNKALAQYVSKNYRGKRS